MSPITWPLASSALLLLLFSIFTRLDAFVVVMDPDRLPETRFVLEPAAERTGITVEKKNFLSSVISHEDVCEMKIVRNYRPTHGHELNGTRVEIQQDEERSFSATFVECVSETRDECHGIDSKIYSSECVTVYEHRPAGVRIAGSTADFAEGYVKVPITCQCRLRKRGAHFLLD